MIGTLIKIKGGTHVIGIVVEPTINSYWRVLGMQNHRWYELRLDNPYIEVLSESR